MATASRTSPYLGLAPFAEHDAPYFFGRSKDARLIMADLFASPLTILYGSSGAGKSSLLRAGVLPLLRGRSDLLPVLASDWQGDASHSLHVAVTTTAVSSTDADPDTSRSLRTALGALDTASLRSILARIADALGRRVMIILDQFEEYLLYHNADDQLGADLCECVATLGLSASFMISLREDTIARLDRFEGRIPALFDSLRRVEQLDRAAAEAAISKPLEAFSLHNHHKPARYSIDPELVQEILADVRVDSELDITAPRRQDRFEAPYLQLVMARLWEEEQLAGSVRLRLETLRRLGGAERIVQTHLDKVMERLPDADQKIAAEVFQLLVTPSASKVAHTIRDLADYAAVDRRRVASILDMLSRGSERVLRPLPGPATAPTEMRYEIFHDRLGPAIIDWRTRLLTARAVAQAKNAAGTRTKVEQRPRHILSPAPAEIVETPLAPYALLRDLLLAGRVVVVLGGDAHMSTASSPSDTPPPESVERAIALRLSNESDYSGAPDASLPEVAAHYARHFGHERLDQRVGELLASAASPPATFRFIARAAAKVPLHIVSLALDSRLESSFVGQDVSAVRIGTAARGEMMSLLRPGHSTATLVPTSHIFFDQDVSTIFKVWGTIPAEARERRFLITEEDRLSVVARLGRGAIPPAGIRAKLRELPTLFVDVGAGSIIERGVISGLRSAAARSSKSWVLLAEPRRMDVDFWTSQRAEVYRGDLAGVTRA